MVEDTYLPVKFFFITHGSILRKAKPLYDDLFSEDFKQTVRLADEIEELYASIASKRRCQIIDDSRRSASPSFSTRQTYNMKNEIIEFLR